MMHINANQLADNNSLQIIHVGKVIVSTKRVVATTLRFKYIINIRALNRLKYLIVINRMIVMS